MKPSTASRALVPAGVTVDVQLDHDDLRAALKRDVREGLGAESKNMPSVWSYDERGLELYGAITQLDEHYPIRAERDLLAEWAEDIAEMAGAEVLVEVGAGPSERTRLLLQGMAASSAGLAGYVVLDAVAPKLRDAVAVVGDEMGIGVHAVIGNHHQHLGAIPSLDAPLLVAFLGSAFGNLTSVERRELLGELGLQLTPNDRLLLATDLIKPVERLIAAYDDAHGLVAQLNRNLLQVINRELGADFAPERFEHIAVWDDTRSCVELCLRATEAMQVSIPGVDMTVEFAAGEELCTEVGTKFRPHQVGEELAEVGMKIVDRWMPPSGDYLLTLARPTGG